MTSQVDSGQVCTFKKGLKRHYPGRQTGRHSQASTATNHGNKSRLASVAEHPHDKRPGSSARSERSQRHTISEHELKTAASHSTTQWELIRQALTATTTAQQQPPSQPPPSFSRTNSTSSLGNHSHPTFFLLSMILHDSIRSMIINKFFIKLPRARMIRKKKKVHHGSGLFLLHLFLVKNRNEVVSL